MSIRVDDAALWSAIEVALGSAARDGALPPREVVQWAGVARYAAHRPDDPRAARSAVLRTLFLGSGVAALEDAANSSADDPADHDRLLKAAGRLLAAHVRVEAGQEVPGWSGSAALVAPELLALCVRWYDEDAAAAAPLLEVFTGHGADPVEAPEAPYSLVSRLEDWLAERVGTHVTVESATVISGGFSRLMLDVRWSGGDRAERCIVRIEQGGMFATDGAREVAVMRVLAAAGFAVPQVIWEEPDLAVLGEPFFVMERVEGAARLDDAGLDDVLRAVRDLHSLPSDVVAAVAAVDGLPAGSTPEAVIDAQV